MKKEDFVIFSTADWNNPFWTNKQHIAQRLARQGHKVLYIESLGLRTPTLKTQDLSRIISRIKSFFRGARKIEDNLWVYSPLVIPLHQFFLVRYFNQVLLILLLRYLKSSLGFKNIIAWTYNPIVLELMKAIKPHKMVYHSVDDLSNAPGVDKALIKKEEKVLLENVDIIFCTSQRIFENCQRLAPGKAYYFSNVADYEHFSKARTDLPEPSDLIPFPHPRIGFIGAISEYKVDFKLIRSVALKRPDWHWVLIGKIGEGQPGTTIDELQNIPNIHTLGPKAYSQLPGYIRYFDVCTIPTPVNEYTESMFPMKFYEFMAAGRPIVARNIDALKALTEVHYSYSTEEDFIKLTEEALNKGIKNPAVCDSLSQENTWEIRLEKMLRIIRGNEKTLN